MQVNDGGDLLRADVPKKEWRNPADGSGAICDRMIFDFSEGALFI
jgi:hypothetical protein